MEVWISLRREVGVMKFSLDKFPKMDLEYERMEDLSPAQLFVNYRCRSVLQNESQILI